MENKLTEYQVELIGEPDAVQAMLAVASHVEPRIFGKRVLNPGHVILWYRASEHRAGLLEAIRLAAAPIAVEPVEELAEEFDEVAEWPDEEQD